MHQATEQCRQAAIDRFFDGGELHQQAPTIHSPMLRTCVPHSFVVAGDDLSLQTVATAVPKAHWWAQPPISSGLYLGLGDPACGTSRRS